MRNHAMILTLIALVAIAVPAHAHCGGCGAGDHAKKQDDIVDTAVAAGDFKTLAAALTAADLVDALKAEGPYTVFAPTDEAFAKLPKGTVESLLEPENKDQLVSILTYHVVSGELPAKKVVKLESVETLNGQSIDIETTKDGDVMVGQAKVIATDIMASNGVIHVIDTVLLPPEKSTSRMTGDQMIEMAINKGSPLYNHGNPAACAAVYEMTAQALLNLDTELPDGARMALSTALTKMSRTHDTNEQAWIMRRGLDSAYAAMQMDMVAR